LWEGERNKIQKIFSRQRGPEIHNSRPEPINQVVYSQFDSIDSGGSMNNIQFMSEMLTQITPGILPNFN
jgi:hypothetical protein